MCLPLPPHPSLQVEVSPKSDLCRRQGTGACASSSVAEISTCFISRNLAWECGFVSNVPGSYLVVIAGAESICRCGGRGVVHLAPGSAGSERHGRVAPGHAPSAATGLGRPQTRHAPGRVAPAGRGRGAPEGRGGAAPCSRCCRCVQPHGAGRYYQNITHVRVKVFVESYSSDPCNNPQQNVNVISAKLNVNTRA